MINLGKIKFSWKGDWVSGTAYTKDDVVKYGPNSYVCISAHTAGINFTATSSNFDLMTEGVDWDPTPYNALTTYPANTIVRYQDALYISLLETTGNLPTNPTYWDTLSVNRSQGNVYYVGTNGIDSALGTTPSTAFATVAQALSVAASGDTVKIGPGTFEEEFPLTVPQGVSVVGTGIRSTKIVPSTTTEDLDGFLLEGDTGISDLTIGEMFYNNINDTGYAFRFANNITIALRSPYIERVTVLNRGSVTSSADPYGYAAGDAGRGALVDGSKVSRSSIEAAMLFNECTFIVPNSRALIMTNGARSEWLTCFTYFADLAIEGVVGATGRAADGKTYIELSGITGTFNVGNTLSFYDDDNVTVLASGVIEAVSGSRYTLDGSVAGFLTTADVTRASNTITVSGNAQLSTVQQKFGASSLLLDGTGDYLSIASDVDYGFGTGDFTIEGWFYKTAVSTQYLFDTRTILNENSIAVQSNGAGNLRLFVNGAFVLTSSNTHTNNAWNHLAISRASGTTRFFINGVVSTNTYTDATNYGTAKPLFIGATYTGSTSYNGYIDEFRVTKGLARYTTTFTPSTTAFVGDGSTALLLHMDGSNGSTTILDDAGIIQDIRSSTGGTATSITRYDRAEFAAELRSIASANVYGDQGIKADGADVSMNIMAHNFSYIGTGADLSNNKSTVVQANEVIEVNGGRVFYNSVDQAGNYRIGDLFTVDFDTGNVSFQAPAFDVTSLTGINFTDGSNTTIVNPTTVSTGNLVLAGNTISTATGNIIMDPSGSSTVNVNADTNITGNLDVTGDVTIGGNITIGNQTLDTVTVVADFTSNLVPDVTDTYDLGSIGQNWRTLYADTVISNGTGSFIIPVGNISQRPTAVTGMIRYNSELSTFEGYAASAWGSLGGVKSVDGFTYIVPETSPGASNGELEFYTENLAGTGSVKSAGITRTAVTIPLTTASTTSTDGALVVTGGVGVAGTVNIGTDLNVTGNTVLTGDLAVNGGDITTTVTGTATVFNTNATTLNVGGAATAVNIGAGTGTTTINNSSTTITGTLNANGGTLSTNQATFNLLNATASTVNAFGAGTSISIGAATGTTTINNANTVVTGDLAVNGGDITTTATGTATLFNTNATTLNVGGAATTVAIGATTGTTTVRNNLTVSGDLTVNGTTTTINSTTISVDDKNIELASTASPTDVTADGAGITIKGTSDKTFNWVDATNSFTANQNIDVLSGNALKVAGVDKVTETALFPNGNVTIGSVLSTVTVADEIVVTNNLVTNGDVISDNLTQNLYPDTVETLNIGGEAVTVNIGAISGTTTIKNNTDIDGVVRIAGNSISAKPTTSIVASGIIGNSANAGQNGLTTSTDGMNAQFEIEFEFDTGNIVRVTLISGGKGWRAGTTQLVGPSDLIYIKGSTLGGLDGGAVGTVPPTQNDIIISVLGVNTLSVLDGGGVPLDNTGVITAVAYDGSAPIIPTAGPTTFNLLDQYVETVNFARDATTIEIGAVNTLGEAVGTTTVRNNFQANGDVTLNGVFTGATGNIDTNAISLNLVNNTANTINFAGAADTLNIGSVFGVTTINNTLEVPTGIIGDIKGSVFSDTSSVIINAINGDVTANDLQVNGSATFAFDILIQGGDLLTDQTTFNLINETATTLNIGQAATSIVVGATTGTIQLRHQTVQVDGDLAVNGGDITTNQSVFNFITSGATTLNMGSSASVVGIGSTLGTTTVNNNLVAGENLQVDGDTVSTTNTTMNLFNTTATSVNFAGAALSTNIGNSAGTATFAGTMVNFNGDITVKGSDIITDQASFRLLQTPTTVNFADAATTLQVGAASGTTTVRNNLDVDLDLNIDGGDITSSQTTFNLLNSTVTTLNLAGAGTQVNIGSTGGSTNVKNDLNVDGKITVGSSDSSVSTIDSADTSFYLANTTAENLYMGGAATVVEIGSTTGTTTVNNALTVDGQATFELDVQIKGGDLTTNQTTFNLLNTVAETVNFAGAGTTVNIGAVTGTTIVKNALQTNNDVEIRGGDLTTNQSTFNLINTNATTVNFAGGANTVNVAAAGSATNIAGALNVTGITTVSNHIIPGVDVTYDLGSATNRFRDLYLSGSTLSLGGGTISFDGTSFNFQGGTSVGQRVETSSTTFDLLNNIAQTINFGGDATTINLGALNGSTNVRNNLAVAGQITVGSSDSSVSTLAVTDTSFFLANTTAETIYFGGAATSINMGSLGGLTTIATDLTITGDTLLSQDLTVNGNLTLTSLNTTGENNDFVISPQGTGRVIIEPQGGFILNPGTLGNINNVSIGATTRAAGRFTSLEANAQTRFTAGISSVDSTTGTVVVQGGMGVGENLNVEGNVSANQLTLRGTVLFENELSVSSGGTGGGQFNARGILYGNSTAPLQSTAGSDYETPYTGTNQQTSNAILTTTAQGVPVWTDVIDCGTF